MSDLDEKITEIRERHKKDARWHCGPSMICPQAHDDRAFLLNEVTRLRARVEVLEGLAHQSLTVLQCSDDHSEHWCAHCDDNIGGSHIVALRAALEAKP